LSFFIRMIICIFVVIVKVDYLRLIRQDRIGFAVLKSVLVKLKNHRIRRC